MLGAVRGTGCLPTRFGVGLEQWRLGLRDGVAVQPSQSYN